MGSDPRHFLLRYPKTICVLLLVILVYTAFGGYEKTNYSYICLVCGRKSIESRTQLIGMTVRNSHSSWEPRLHWDPRAKELKPHLYDKLIGKEHEHSYRGGGFGTTTGGWLVRSMGDGGHTRRHDPSHDGERANLAASSLPLFEDDPPLAKRMYFRIIRRLEESQNVVKDYSRARQLAENGSGEEWEAFAPETP